MRFVIAKLVSQPASRQPITTHNVLYVTAWVPENGRELSSSCGSGMSCFWIKSEVAYCSGFLDARHARMVGLAREAGVQESSKADPRDGGGGLWGFDLGGGSVGASAVGLSAAKLARVGGFAGRRALGRVVQRWGQAPGDRGGRIQARAPACPATGGRRGSTMSVDGGLGGHELSIRNAGAGAVVRGARPRSKTSTRIMRPPQQGQGLAG